MKYTFHYQTRQSVAVCWEPYSFVYMYISFIIWGKKPESKESSSQSESFLQQNFPGSINAKVITISFTLLNGIQNKQTKFLRDFLSIYYKWNFKCWQ